MKNLILFFMLFCSIKSTAQDTWKPNPKYIKQGKQDTTTATKKLSSVTALQARANAANVG